MHVKKGDNVIVISGNDKGKIGKILEVMIKQNRVVVEGVNITTRHLKPSNENPDGGIEKIEAPIHASNVQILDPKTEERTKIGKKIVDDKKVRYAKKSGEILDK